MKKVNTSGLSFRDIREGGKYYVDKSLLIKDMLDTDDRGVFLYTRPRRFGKTTNLTMLDAFFNIEYKGNTWFDGLAISEHPDCMCQMSRYPVILLDLKDLAAEGNNDYGIFVSRVKKVLSDLYNRFTYLLDSPRIGDRDRRLFESVLYMDADENVLADAVRDLSRMLHLFHGERTVILVDEYDQSITQTFGDALQERVIGFLRLLLSSALKSNGDLQMAYVTGVMQVAKAGFFSGMNNISINNTFSVESDERFGFTEPEVRDILSYYGHPEKFDEARDWYDGYRFGDAEVYNPFSIMTYVQRGFQPDSYWRDSSRNTPMLWMLERAGAIGLQAVADLVNGGTMVSELHRTMSYDEMRLNDPVDLLSLMVMTGYLNAIPKGDGLYELSVPNREAMGIVDSLLSRNRRIGNDAFERFNAAVLDGDAAAMTEVLQSVLADGSYFSLRDESSYENIVLTMMHGMLRGYRITSQKESGNGRADLVLEPRDEGSVPIILELKVSDSEGSLDSDAESAIAQIHDKNYYLGMRGDVILIGLAFRGKLVRGKVERIHLRGRMWRGHDRARRPRCQGQQADEQDTAPLSREIRGRPGPRRVGIGGGAQQGLRTPGGAHNPHSGDQHQVRAVPRRREDKGAPRPQRRRRIRGARVPSGRALPRHQQGEPGGDHGLGCDTPDEAHHGPPVGLRGEGGGGRQEARGARRHIRGCQEDGRERVRVLSLGGRGVPHGEGADGIPPGRDRYGGSIAGSCRSCVSPRTALGPRRPRASRRR